MFSKCAMVGVLVFGLAAGCAPGVPVSDEITPVNLVKARETLMTQTPGTVAFEIETRRAAYLIGENGNAVFFAKSSLSGLTEQTKIASFDANKICLAPVGSWSGVCISMFETPAGSLLCRFEGGNGHVSNEACTVVALTEEDSR